MGIYEVTRAETNAFALRILNEYGQDDACEIYRAWLVSAALHLTAVNNKQSTISFFHSIMCQIGGNEKPRLVINNAVRPIPITDGAA